MYTKQVFINSAEKCKSNPKLDYNATSDVSSTLSFIQPVTYGTEYEQIKEKGTQRDREEWCLGRFSAKMNYLKSLNKSVTE